jgi:hypothetical protein
LDTRLRSLPHLQLLRETLSQVTYWNYDRKQERDDDPKLDGREATRRREHVFQLYERCSRGRYDIFPRASLRSLCASFTPHSMTLEFPPPTAAVPTPAQLLLNVVPPLKVIVYAMSWVQLEPPVVAPPE